MPKPPPRSPSTPRGPPSGAIAACLNEGSVLTEKSLWTEENVGYLVRHFVENLDDGEGGFFEKLESQLAKAPASAKQLAAEMFWVMYLFSTRASMQPGTKRRQIRQVWEWSGEPLPDAPFELNEALEDGVANPGMAFHQLRWKEFLFFIVAMKAWTASSRPQREARLAEPWNLAEWLKEQDDAGTRQLRHILLYLLFPDHFEPYATALHKRTIVREFTKKFGEDPNQFDYKDRVAVDRQLRVVRERLRAEGAAEDFGFHDEPYLKVWRPGPGVGNGDDDLPSRGEEAAQWYQEKFGDARVWAFAAGAGARHWDEFRENGIIAIGWDQLGDLREFDKRESIHEELRDILDKPNPHNDSLACYRVRPRDAALGTMCSSSRGARCCWATGSSNPAMSSTRAVLNSDTRGASSGIRWVVGGSRRSVPSPPRPSPTSVDTSRGFISPSNSWKTGRDPPPPPRPPIGGSRTSSRTVHSTGKP